MYCTCTAHASHMYSACMTHVQRMYDACKVTHLVCAYMYTNVDVYKLIMHTVQRKACMNDVTYDIRTYSTPLMPYL